jgi:Family of unknown function (DUF5682)
MNDLPTSLAPLQAQLLAAAAQFADDTQPLSQLLSDLASDVEKVLAEPLEIFPVCHHSPISAIQMVQRLQQNPPKVIYLELCEDLRPTIENLADCQLPVALQAFAAESSTFSADLMPLSVIAPLTEASAEYQAIAYALQSPDTEIVFVDRSADLVVQWEPPDPHSPENADEPPGDEAEMHGGAIAVEIGQITPSFDIFLKALLKNSQTRHFAEWWDQYVEQALIGADYHTYRQVFSLVGSLIRRLGTKQENLDRNRQRESLMWTRIKQHMQAHQVNTEDAIFICGAAHAASDVAEYGIANPIQAEIPEVSQTTWLYGIIPSSFTAIEYQFHHPAGTISLAESTWSKSLKLAKLSPFRLAKLDKEKSTKVKQKKASTTSNQADKILQVGDLQDRALVSLLTRSPSQVGADQDQLLNWCVNIVALARKNGYLASTADAIAILQTSMLLANIRQRSFPSPYDFQDAAITCLEKDYMPKKRNIAQICRILLGGDRIGTVGYASLPPLAQNVYDRLAALNINLFAKTNQRALLDFKQQPELFACSDVLWRLRWLIGDFIVHPIIGERSLGYKPVQESWEVRLGKHQRNIILLGYEGVTIEQVLEQRLKQQSFAPEAKAAHALAAAEDSLLYLQHPRLTEAIGSHATNLLSQETAAEDAPSIFDRIRRLVHYYRSTPKGLPDWIERFVSTGYAHYSTLLPVAFGDRGTSPTQISGMLSFIFTLESLALALGCQRSQLLISIQQTAQTIEDPAKMGLLWTAEWLLKLKDLAVIRSFFASLLQDHLRIQAFPEYLNGFILALTFAPRMGGFVVELLNQLFATVPDAVLLPQLPQLILGLRSQSQLLSPLIKDAGNSFPNSLKELDRRQPLVWQTEPLETSPQIPIATKIVTLSATERTIQQLLNEYPDTVIALANWLGIEAITWQDSNPDLNQNLSGDRSQAQNSEQPRSLSPLSQIELAVVDLLQTYPAAFEAHSLALKSTG